MSPKIKKEIPSSPIVGESSTMGAARVLRPSATKPPGTYNYLAIQDSSLDEFNSRKRKSISTIKPTESIEDSAQSSKRARPNDNKEIHIGHYIKDIRVKAVAKLNKNGNVHYEPSKETSSNLSLREIVGKIYQLSFEDIVLDYGIFGISIEAMKNLSESECKSLIKGLFDGERSATPIISPEENCASGIDLPEQPLIRVGRSNRAHPSDKEIPVMATLSKDGKKLLLSHNSAEAEASLYFYKQKAEMTEVDFDMEFDQGDEKSTRDFIKQYLVRRKSMEVSKSSALKATHNEEEAEGIAKLNNNAIIAQPNAVEYTSEVLVSPEVHFNALQNSASEILNAGKKVLQKSHVNQLVSTHKIIQDALAEAFIASNQQQARSHDLEEQVQNLKEQYAAETEEKNQRIEEQKGTIEKKDIQIKDLEAQLANSRPVAAEEEHKLGGRTYTKLKAPNANEGLYVDEGKHVMVGSTRYRETEVLSEYQNLDVQGTMGEFVYLDGLEFRRVSGGPYNGRLIQKPGPESLITDGATGNTFVQYLIRKEDPLDI